MMRQFMLMKKLVGVCFCKKKKGYTLNIKFISIYKIPDCLVKLPTKG